MDFFSSTKPLPGGFNEPLLGGSFGDPLPDVLEAVLGEGDTIQLQSKIEKVYWEDK
jgi:hypothetical protein